MKSKHTQGPWEACIYSGPFDQPLILSSDGAIGRLHGMEDRQHEANAKLIAAAPDLLEACLTAKALFQAQGINENSRIGGAQYKQLLEAIRKAIK